LTEKACPLKLCKNAICYCLLCVDRVSYSLRSLRNGTLIQAGASPVRMCFHRKFAKIACAAVAQSAERVLGKDEVTGSNPVSSSIKTLLDSGFSDHLWFGSSLSFISRVSRHLLSVAQAVPITLSGNDPFCYTFCYTLESCVLSRTYRTREHYPHDLLKQLRIVPHCLQNHIGLIADGRGFILRMRTARTPCRMRLCARGKIGIPYGR
jgi:hypothetical protein